MRSVWGKYVPISYIGDDLDLKAKSLEMPGRENNNAVRLNVNALSYRPRANPCKARFAIYNLLEMLIEAWMGMSFTPNTKRLRLYRVQRQAKTSNPESRETASRLVI